MIGSEAILSNAAKRGELQPVEPVEPVVDAQGERPAFASMVTHNIDFIWRTVRRLGVPASEADDATQQVFLLANDKLDSIRPGSERAFLIAVATRVASHARRAIQRREQAQRRLSEHPTAVISATDPATQRLEARDLLDRVLNTMPSKTRTVFVLFELEDMSVDDIAALLELPRGTVATRLRRARMLFEAESKRLKAQRRKGQI